MRPKHSFCQLNRREFRSVTAISAGSRSMISGAGGTQRRCSVKIRFLVVSALLAGLCTWAGTLRRGHGFASQQPARTTTQNIWSIGIYTGTSPFQLTAPVGVTNPVLTPADVTDWQVNIVAHPFMVVSGSRYYMFFTAKNDLGKEQSGIGLAESNDGLRWEYKRIVLKEPFVLSYPYVFKWQNDYYMIPESYTEKFVRLYRATSFPNEWIHERDLLTGDVFISASVVRHAGLWWMFVGGLGNDTLRLFFAEDLKGKWMEHPLSPVIDKDLNTARPGGRPIVVDGVLYRIGQDCYPTYGNQAFAFRVSDISATTYKEQMLGSPLVRATSKGWNADAMHHVDLHQISKNKWIAAVDAKGTVKTK